MNDSWIPTHRVAQDYNPYRRGDLLRLTGPVVGGVHEPMRLYDDEDGSSAWMPPYVMDRLCAAGEPCKLRPNFCGDVDGHGPHDWLWVDEMRHCRGGGERRDETVEVTDPRLSLLADLEALRVNAGMLNVTVVDVARRLFDITERYFARDELVAAVELNDTRESQW